MKILKITENGAIGHLWKKIKNKNCGETQALENQT